MGHGVRFKVTTTTIVEPDTHFGTIWDFTEEVIAAFGDRPDLVIKFNNTTAPVLPGDTGETLARRWRETLIAIQEGERAQQ